MVEVVVVVVVVKSETVMGMAGILPPGLTGEWRTRGCCVAGCHQCLCSD